MSPDTTPTPEPTSDMLPVQPALPAQQQFFNQLLKDDDIEWKSLLLEAVRSNAMDPWDIELSFIATQFLKMVREYREMNFKLSGKVILAAALLLRLKSNKFVSHDINALDALIASTQSDASDDIIHDEVGDGLTGDEYRQGLLAEVAEGQPQLYPRTPQPRKRKVSVYDLIKALEQALEVNKRRELRYLDGSAQGTLAIPTKSFDITKGLNSVYRAIAQHYVDNAAINSASGLSAEQLTFFKLIPSTKRHDKVFTFIPLLHLRNMQKVDMNQTEHFGDFSVVLTNPDPKAALTEEIFIAEEATATVSLPFTQVEPQAVTDMQEKAVDKDAEVIANGKASDAVQTQDNNGNSLIKDKKTTQTKRSTRERTKRSIETDANSNSDGLKTNTENQVIKKEDEIKSSDLK